MAADPGAMTVEDAAERLAITGECGTPVDVVHIL